MPLHHTILQHQTTAITSVISQSYQHPALSFITVATPSPLSRPGPLAHTTVNPAMVVLWTILFSSSSFNIKLLNKKWSCGFAKIYNPACRTSCSAFYRRTHHMWKHGCWNLSLTTRNACLHISAFPKALWQWLPENLVSIIIAMCIRLNLNREGKKYFILVTYLLIPEWRWVRSQNSNRRRVWCACCNHTPLMRRRQKWQRMWFWHTVRLHANLRKCLWPCMVVNSHQYDVSANNSTHLLVITPDTRHHVDTANELLESSEARMSGPNKFGTQACGERHFPDRCIHTSLSDL